MKKLLVILVISSFGQLAAQTFEKIIETKEHRLNLFNFVQDENDNTYFLAVRAERRNDSLFQDHLSWLYKINNKGERIQTKQVLPSNINTTWANDTNHVMLTSISIEGDSLHFIGNVRTSYPTEFAIIRVNSDLNFNFGTPTVYNPINDSIPIFLNKIEDESRSIYFGERYNMYNGILFGRLAVFSGTSFQEVRLFGDSLFMWNDIVQRLLRDKNGGFYSLALEYQGPPLYFMEGPTVVKLDSSFNYVDRRRLNVPARNQSETVVFRGFANLDAVWLTDTTFLIGTAHSNAIDTIKGDIHLFVYDTNLTRQTYKRLVSADTNQSSRSNCLAYDSLSGSIYFGSTQTIEVSRDLWFHGDQTAFNLIKMDKTLNILWEKTYYNEATIQLDEIEVDKNGNVTMAGTYEDSTTRANGFNRNIYILRVDSLGNYLRTDLTEGAIPTRDFVIYPNPVGDQLNFKKFNRFEPYHVQFFDVTGKVIKQMLWNTNETSISTANWKPGTYIYRLVDNKGRNAEGKLIKK